MFRFNQYIVYMSIVFFILISRDVYQKLMNTN